MLVSAIFSSRMMIASHTPAMVSYGSGGASNLSKAVPRVGNGCGDGLAIECSSRPKKKATAHHMKTRPRKRQPWDIKRKPTVYPPLPPLPPEWTLVSSASDNAAEALVAAPPPPAPSQ